MTRTSSGRRRMRQGRSPERVCAPTNPVNSRKRNRLKFDKQGREAEPDAGFRWIIFGTAQKYANKPLDTTRNRPCNHATHEVAGFRMGTSLADGTVQPGRHGVQFDGRGLPIGIYVCRLTGPAASGLAGCGTHRTYPNVAMSSVQI
jgi:hypothetical protein